MFQKNQLINNKKDLKISKQFILN